MQPDDRQEKQPGNRNETTGHRSGALEMTPRSSSAKPRALHANFHRDLNYAAQAHCSQHTGSP
jgi:hypothetical protein